MSANLPVAASAAAADVPLETAINFWVKTVHTAGGCRDIMAAHATGERRSVPPVVEVGWLDGAPISATVSGGKCAEVRICPLNRWPIYPKIR